MIWAVRMVVARVAQASLMCPSHPYFSAAKYRCCTRTRDLVALNWAQMSASTDFEYPPGGSFGPCQPRMISRREIAACMRRYAV
ncbi:hypothetical protein F5Y19DRAFT_448941 [Xylariaceae sp. FL1651]|nr:hypothetical protein F5Y19DRAFT_448941 [Xylariaceae sp. FL1651]